MGALTAKSVKPKIIYAANGQKLKEIWCRGTKIWGGTVKITFVEGSARTTIEYEEGATVNRGTAPSGASFVGWSTSPSGTNAARTFKATQDMTVYRVIRYADISGTITSNYSRYISTPGNYSKITFTSPELHNIAIMYCPVSPPSNIGMGDAVSNYGAEYLVSGSYYYLEANNPYRVGYYLFWSNPAYTYTRTFSLIGKTVVG